MKNEHGHGVFWMSTGAKKERSREEHAHSFYESIEKTSAVSTVVKTVLINHPSSYMVRFLFPKPGGDPDSY